MVPLETFDEKQREILGWMVRCEQNNVHPNDLTAGMELSEAANKELSRILLRGAGDRERSDVDAFEDSIKILRRVALRKKYFALLDEADKYMADGNPVYVEKFQEAFKVKTTIDNL